MINVWGADHHGYIARMKAALASLGYNPNQLEIVITQMVKLFQNGELVKMSKRTGKAVTLVDLMEEVGTDAARYFFVMRSPDTHLDFDMDLAVSKSNENPVYYVQYAHARMMSVFRQAEAKGITPSRDREDLKLLREEQEYDLLEKLGSFPGEIASSAAQLAPTSWFVICMSWLPTSIVITTPIASSAMMSTCRGPDWLCFKALPK